MAYELIASGSRENLVKLYHADLIADLATIKDNEPCEALKTAVYVLEDKKTYILSSAGVWSPNE